MPAPVACVGVCKDGFLAMAQNREQLTRETRSALINWRVSTAEREHLRKAAVERGTTISDMVRDGLRNQGVLPAK